MVAVAATAPAPARNDRRERALSTRESSVFTVHLLGALIMLIVLATSLARSIFGNKNLLMSGDERVDRHLRAAEVS
jgi:hypothetical protein